MEPTISQSRNLEDRKLLAAKLPCLKSGPFSSQPHMAHKAQTWLALRSLSLCQVGLRVESYCKGTHRLRDHGSLTDRNWKYLYALSCGKSPFSERSCTNKKWSAHKCKGKPHVTQRLCLLLPLEPLTLLGVLLLLLVTCVYACLFLLLIFILIIISIIIFILIIVFILLVILLFLLCKKALPKNEQCLTETWLSL